MWNLIPLNIEHLVVLELVLLLWERWKTEDGEREENRLIAREAQEEVGKRRSGKEKKWEREVVGKRSSGAPGEKGESEEREWERILERKLCVRGERKRRRHINQRERERGRGRERTESVQLSQQLKSPNGPNFSHSSCFKVLWLCKLPEPEFVLFSLFTPTENSLNSKFTQLWEPSNPNTCQNLCRSSLYFYARDFTTTTISLPFSERERERKVLSLNIHNDCAHSAHYTRNREEKFWVSSESAFSPFFSFLSFSPIVTNSTSIGWSWKDKRGNQRKWKGERKKEKEIKREGERRRKWAGIKEREWLWRWASLQPISKTSSSWIFFTPMDRSLFSRIENSSLFILLKFFLSKFSSFFRSFSVDILFSSLPNSVITSFSFHFFFLSSVYFLQWRNEEKTEDGRYRNQRTIKQKGKENSLEWYNFLFILPPTTKKVFPPTVDSPLVIPFHLLCHSLSSSVSSECEWEWVFATLHFFLAVLLLGHHTQLFLSLSPSLHVIITLVRLSLLDIWEDDRIKKRWGGGRTVDRRRIVRE